MSLSMRSAVHDLMPPLVRRSLVKLGADLSLVRRKRTLPGVVVLASLREALCSPSGG